MINIASLVKRVEALEAAQARELNCRPWAVMRNSHDSPERSAEIDAEIEDLRRQGIEPVVIFIQGVKPGDHCLVAGGPDGD